MNEYIKQLNVLIDNLEQDANDDTLIQPDSKDSEWINLAIDALYQARDWIEQVGE